jgi:hypothetical protein
MTKPTQIAVSADHTNEAPPMITYPINSRFAICDCGSGFSVEDRRTGQRVSYHVTYAKALRARQAASKAAAQSSLERPVPKASSPLERPRQ